MEEKIVELQKQVKQQQTTIEQHELDKTLMKSELENKHSKELQSLHDRVAVLIEKKDAALREKEAKIAELHELVHE